MFDHMSVLANRRPRRAQALVLFGLFLLVLVVMVMATLSLAHITHAKMEMQVASDAAAYSQAVATARAYNSVALLNRAQLSTMVAVSGVDSAIDFSSSYRAAVNATWWAYCDQWNAEYCGGFHMGTFSESRQYCEGNSNTDKVDCTGAAHGEDSFDRSQCFGPACKVSYQIFGWGLTPSGAQGYNDNSRMNMVINETERLRAVWQSLDEAAGTQARNIQAEAASYGAMQAASLATARGVFQSFADQAVSATGASVNTASTGISHREFDDGSGSGDFVNGVEAGMGSRAHLFITQRADGERALETAVKRMLQPSGGANEVTFDPLKGNGYFSVDKNHGARPADGYAVWGDDHAAAHVDYQGIDANKPGACNLGTCTGNTSQRKYESWVSSTDLQNTADQHDWCPHDFEPETVPPDQRHTMLPHAVPARGPDPCAASSCIWPQFYDTNAGNLTDAADAFGQPKMMTSASYDLSAKKSPWNMLFSLHWQKGPDDTKVNLTNQHPVENVNPKLEAISTAMAYYHRPGHWQEPPNLFNPYWRATLVKATTDDASLADAKRTVSRSNAAALGALQNAGFKGVP